MPWSVKALEAGKHVLCEKPLGLNAADARVLYHTAARHPWLTVMEGFMYRSHPRWKQVRQLVIDGAVGELGCVRTIFSYDNRNPGDIRNIAEIGGGAWLDIGCYGVSAARFLFGAEPNALVARMELDPIFGTDRLTSAILDFGRGSATVTCATQLAPHQAVSLHGSSGRIELELPFNPPAETPTSIRLHRDGAMHEIMVEPCDQFRAQVDCFADAVAARGSTTGVAGGLAREHGGVGQGSAAATIDWLGEATRHRHSWSRRFRGFGYRQRPSTQYQPPRACAQCPASHRR